MINILIVYGTPEALNIALAQAAVANSVKVAKPQQKLYANKATGEETRVSLKLVQRVDDITAIRGQRYDIILEDSSFHELMLTAPLEAWADSMPLLLSF